MSQVETSPVLNNTTVTNINNQSIDTLPASIIYGFGTISPLYNEMSSFTIPTSDWVQIAKMEKFFDSLTWSSTSTGIIKTIEINFSTLKKLVPAGQDLNTFLKYGSLMFSIKKTDNAYFQGQLMVAFDPSPDPDYFRYIFNKDDSPTLKHIWQLQHFMIQPKTSGDVNFTVPLNYVLNYVLLQKDAIMYTQTQDYNLGRILFQVVAPLESKNEVTSLTYPIRASMINLDFGGVRVRSADIADTVVLS
jgi:hypothetical protein